MELPPAPFMLRPPPGLEHHKSQHDGSDLKQSPLVHHDAGLSDGLSAAHLGGGIPGISSALDTNKYLANPLNGGPGPVLQVPGTPTNALMMQPIGGGVANGAGGYGGMAPQSPTDPFWMDRFNELNDFVKQNNHCSPSYLHHPQLYSWLHRQKFLMRKDKLAPEKVKLLVSLGVQFEYHWDEMYNQLKRAKEEYFHGRPNNTNTDFWRDLLSTDSKAAYWVWAQISMWRNSKLNAERIKKLEEAGISLDMDSLKPPKGYSKKKRKNPEGSDDEDKLQHHTPEGERVEKKTDATWLAMLQKLMEYKQSHPNVAPGPLMVPMQEDKRLSLWVRTQRQAWRDGKLSTWKQRKLEEVGFTPQMVEPMRTSKKQQHRNQQLSMQNGLSMVPHPHDGLTDDKHMHGMEHLQGPPHTADVQEEYEKDHSHMDPHLGPLVEMTLIGGPHGYLHPGQHPQSYVHAPIPQHPHPGLSHHSQLPHLSHPGYHHQHQQLHQPIAQHPMSQITPMQLNQMQMNPLGPMPGLGQIPGIPLHQYNHQMATHLPPPQLH